ncbi:DUF1592 domain-containing protein [Opitutales bacterium]|nr:DUF1592 domain-containing protein [Opitutales bacterium]MDC1004248.1 DUF1592 domain-containing protein [Opitutales bacterium]
MQSLFKYYRIFFPALFFLHSIQGKEISSVSYQAQVLPALEKHCIQCHGPEKQKGDVRFDTLSIDFLKDRTAAETWHDASDQIKLGEMPPEEENPLSEGERKLITEWIDSNLEKALREIKGEQSEAVIRRLNRTEYQYTMEDLLGFKMDYVDGLARDPLSPNGFLNNGKVLGMSSLQIEHYLKTARKAFQLILNEEEEPTVKVSEVKWNKGNIRGPSSKLYVGKSDHRLGRVNYWHGNFQQPPKSGRFTIRIKARSERKPGYPSPILEGSYGFFVSGLTLNIQGSLPEVEIDSNETKTYEISSYAKLFPMTLANVPDDKINGVLTFRNSLDDGNPLPKQLEKITETKDKKGKIKKKKTNYYPEDPNFSKIIIESVEFVANDYSSWPSKIHQQIILPEEGLNNERTAKLVISRFLTKAWRKPIDSQTAEKWFQHFKKISRDENSSIYALRETLATSLASTNFIYLSEPKPNKSKPSILSSHELAARLSYFLWSSMPDNELRALADKNRLSDSKVLAIQIKRMLRDPKSNRFAEEFSKQWLDLGGVDRVAVNPRYHKNFDNRLKPYMQAESLEFFKEIFKKDEPMTQIIDADFTMLNARLAKHYGVEGPKSQRFERTSLKGTNRAGGILGHASIHLSGSDGAESHPIRRAVWVRERLLHDPPKPPPPDVPGIEESVKDFEKLSLHEQIEFHRKKESCNDCHRTLDPWGIALEEYSAVGLKREETTVHKKPITSDTILPGNHPVDGVEELQKFILSHRKDQFAHAFCSKVLTYALGRSLTLEDEILVNELKNEFVKNRFRLSGLLKNIVLSETFRWH